MVTLLKDGTLCLLDDPKINVARWWVEHTGGWKTGPVSDERLAYLLDYFENVEVGNDDGKS